MTRPRLPAPLLASLVPLTLPAALAALCSGCGLAETAASGAAGASAEVRQAQQAPKIEQQVRDQIQAAQDVAAQQRDKVEQDAQ